MSLFNILDRSLADESYQLSGFNYCHNELHISKLGEEGKAWCMVTLHLFCFRVCDFEI